MSGMSDVEVRSKTQEQSINDELKNWTILFFLCGDHDEVADSIRENFERIKDASFYRNLKIAVQADVRNFDEEEFDGSGKIGEGRGFRQFLMPSKDGKQNWESTEKEPLGQVNTGSSKNLSEFIETSFDRLGTEKSEHVAIVIAGLGIRDPNSIVGNIETKDDFGRVFSVCDDEGANDALNPIELKQVLEHIVNERREGEPIDVLAFDMSSMQYIEVAHQFNGLARVMVGSQNNQLTDRWPYDEIINEIGAGLAKDSQNLHQSLIVGDAIVRAAGEQLDTAQLNSVRPIISALDLSLLDVVTRSIDTLFLALMQTMGDKVVWQVRVRTFHDLLQDHERQIKDEAIKGRDDNKPFAMIAYDLYHLLEKLHENLKKVTQLNGALQIWYEEQLDQICKKRPEKNTSDRFYDPVYAELNEQFHERRAELRKEMERRVPVDSADLKSKLEEQIALTIQDDDPLANFLTFLGEQFEKLDFKEVEKSIHNENALHLRAICADVKDLIKPPVIQYESRSGKKRRNKKKTTFTPERFIFSQFRPSSSPDSSSKNEPSHCGISIYRPESLDRLVNSQYLDFDFHKRVHWVSLLGSVNLIENHPGAMWRVISSLLATASTPARDDLLQRLIGPASVMNDFGQHFRALQQPPTLTLTLAEEIDTWDMDVIAKHESEIDAPNIPENGTPQNEVAEEAEEPMPSPPKSEEGFIYRLTLVSNQKDATVDEQKSVVNRRSIDNTLIRLERLLRHGTGSANDIEQLKSFAQTLGEDVFQRLNEKVRDYYVASMEETSGLVHMQLQLPIDLMQFPWEIMHDGKGMLCERFALGRQVLLKAGASRRAVKRKARKIKVLIIGDPVLEQAYSHLPQLPGAVEEVQNVEKLFDRLKDQLPGTIETSDCFIHDHFTGDDFRKLLRTEKYDIIHYAGHAQHDPHRPERSAWMLSDGPLWAQQINNTLQQVDSPPWLIYANACESGMESQHSSKYQSNVFGLATAFINEGVTAYLGPLWPINDAVANQIATDFYSDLLLERASVGEALFMAKRNAQQRLQGGEFGTLMNLSWASMILYGDSTMKLLDSLGGGSPSSTQPTAKPKATNDRIDYEKRLYRRRKYSITGLPPRPMQESVHATLDAVRGPEMKFQSSSRGSDSPPDSSLAIELVEVNGLRHWQFWNRREQRYTALPDSPIREKIKTNRLLKQRLGISPDAFDYSRVIGRWLIGRQQTQKVERLAEMYDQEAVPDQRLVLVNSKGDVQPLNSAGLRWVEDRIGNSRADRVLLLLHGSFGSTQKLLRNLGPEFTRWAFRNHAAVIGFDHWAVTESPESNANELWEGLSKFSILLKPNTIDILGFARGGLVARSLLEISNPKCGKENELRASDIVRKVILAATPSNGSSIDSPKKWGIAADLFANLIHIDSTGLYGKLSGLLARFAAANNVMASRNSLSKVAGLESLFPQSPFMTRLNNSQIPQGVDYSFIAADYDGGEASNVLQLLRDTKTLNFEEKLGKFSDLLVNAEGVAWKEKFEPNDSEITSEKPMLILTGEKQKLIEELDLDTDSIEVEHAPGIHHTNLLSNELTHAFIKKQLAKNKSY